MNIATNLLISQTREANNWTTKLINETDHGKWFATPDVIDTNIAWQLGHLTLSQYYYLIILVSGPKKELAEKINMKKYSGLFANGQKRKELETEISFSELKENWALICESSIQLLEGLNDVLLNEEIIKMPKPHPFVKTKLDSVSWNIKHTMWHCGQMGTLKRVIDKPFDFGL